MLIRARPVLRGLVKLNRCVRSLKLYVVANTHAHLPRDTRARAERERERERVPRVFWIKTFVSTPGLPRPSFITLLSLSPFPSVNFASSSLRNNPLKTVRAWPDACETAFNFPRFSPPFRFFSSFYPPSTPRFHFSRLERTRDDGGGA